MKSLRQIEPIRNATAAILPGYTLKFYSDAAFVEPVEMSSSSSSLSSVNVVHGVLYALTASDFARVGQTEGVPWGYRWQQCKVYPYVGDGLDAGRRRLLLASNEEEECTFPVTAYTLGGNNMMMKYTTATTTPPSASYLGLIQEGARLWNMDQDYQEMLRQVPVSTANFLLNDGLAGMTLKIAERLTGTERTYSIPPAAIPPHQ
jgi:hypothetical protein